MELDPVLVVIGPSASGKSSVVRELDRRGLVDVIPTWTTRPRREDELDGSVEHRFADEAEFAERHRSGFFVEVVQLFGLPYSYGLPAPRPPRPGRIAAVIARAPVMTLVARHYRRRVVYQVEDAYERARQRLTGRALAGDRLGTRLDRFESERLAGRALADRTFVNAGDIGDLVEAVASAVSEDFTHVRKEQPCHSGA